MRISIFTRMTTSVITVGRTRPSERTPRAVKSRRGVVVVIAGTGTRTRERRMKGVQVNRWGVLHRLVWTMGTMWTTIVKLSAATASTIVAGPVHGRNKGPMRTRVVALHVHIHVVGMIVRWLWIMPRCRPCWDARTGTRPDSAKWRSMLVHLHLSMASLIEFMRSFI
ncbi:hypothetical protein BDP27DRAFT_1325367 [Rhodocollybia butyracea]|uniref:Uncharacterized protein n=1 Tax=Rhodocollybia butyracea TaxID=206335 RepID=A0A9P5U8Y9_9AGAR|nr:hypothetical protein BDP27DRAFT_1325367 [Rhodocollybia butyracea]